MHAHFSRGQGPMALARSSCASWSCKARNPRPERFNPLSDENFFTEKVRELRAYSWRRKNAEAFFRLFHMLIKYERFGHISEVMHCSGGSRSFASRPLAGEPPPGKVRLRRPACAAGPRKSQRPLTPRRMHAHSSVFSHAFPQLRFVYLRAVPFGAKTREYSTISRPVPMNRVCSGCGCAGESS